eukprot:GFYU01020344.1.p1 GENE.GFYU01020344.1~~GFYU01020344.1.p1  ORF type:complete len:114 (-),score=19.10 GFYU01020344.1:225-518(-)
MVDVVLPPLKFFKGLLQNPWLTETFIHEIPTPILFLSGLQDEVIPAEMMQRLHDKAVSSLNREIVKFPTGTHNDTWLKGGKQYYEHLKRFVDKVSKL